MRPSDYVLVTLVLSAACDATGKKPLACPEATTPMLTRGVAGPDKRRVCIEADGITAHGPIVEVGADGVERLVGRMVHGKRDGHFVDNVAPGLTTESDYKGGVVDGRYVVRDGSGAVVSEQEFRAGRRHGMRREWVNGSLRKLEVYDAGRPSGTWELRGEAGIVKRRYGAEGVLLSVDGVEVSPPPATITLPDNTVLARSECVRQAEDFIWDGVRPPARPLCLELFEQWQVCADAPCRAEAVTRYVQQR